MQKTVSRVALLQSSAINVRPTVQSLSRAHFSRTERVQWTLSEKIQLIQRGN